LSTKKIKKALKYFETQNKLVESGIINLNTDSPLDYYFILPNPLKVNNFDSNGIPLLYNRFTKEHDYHLTVISHLMLYLVSLIVRRSASEEQLLLFKSLINYLRNNEFRGFYFIGGWKTSLPNFGSKCSGSFFNASAISNCISALLRYSIFKQDVATYDMAIRAFNVFKHFDADGVLTRLSNNEIWFDTYPNCVGSKILSGHLNSLFGLYDLSKFGQIKEAEALFQNGCESLKKSFYLFDIGHWVSYGIEGYAKHPSTIHYVQDISQRLEVLYRITNDMELMNLKTKIDGYLLNPICRAKALVGKIFWATSNQIFPTYK
jgi:hypothetical protein